MPRTLIAVTAAAPTGTAPAPTTADATNDHYIAAAVTHERHILHVVQTAVTAKTITILAGSRPPAEQAGKGAIGPISMAQNAERYFEIESARHVRMGDAEGDGIIAIDLEAGFTGTLEVIAHSKGGAP